MSKSFPAVAAALTVLAASGAGIGAHAADRFVLDPTHTFVQFSVDRFGYNAVLGLTPGVRGEVTLDPDRPEKSSVAAALDLNTLVSFDATRDEHLKGPFWFNVAKFPSISFISTGVTLTSENAADVLGMLNLHGVEAPVTLHVKLNKRGPDPATKKDAVGFSATATLKRSDFGMTTALGMVGDDVEIRIEAMAHIAE